MSQTALIIKNDAKEKVYSLNLSMYLNTDILAKSSVTDFIKLIDVFSKLDLVIIEESDFNENEIKNIISEIEQRKMHTPVLCITKRATPYKDEHLVNLDGDIKPLLKVAALKLGITALDMAKLKTPEYVSFFISFFDLIDFTPCSLFILKEQKYETFIQAKSPLPQQELQKLKDQKIEKLYLQSKDRLKFTNFFTENMDKKLKEVKPAKNKVAETGAAVAVTHQYIKEMGLDETALKMTKSCIDSMYEMVKNVGSKGSTLDKLLSELLDNQTSYNFTHSQLTAFLACHAVAQMSWGSQEQKEKIVFISFFHNILLNDETCKIQTEEEVKALALPQKDKDTILKHAQNTAQLISQYPKVPIGSDDILKQHHGSRNGIGFPEQASASISPLAMVFYVSELLAHALLNKPFDQKATFEKIYQKAPKGTKTKNIIEALEKLDFSQFMK